MRGAEAARLVEAPEGSVEVLGCVAGFSVAPDGDAKPLRVITPHPDLPR